MRSYSAGCRDPLPLNLPVAGQLHDVLGDAALAYDRPLTEREAGARETVGDEQGGLFLGKRDKLGFHSVTRTRTDSCETSSIMAVYPPRTSRSLTG